MVTGPQHPQDSCTYFSLASEPSHQERQSVLAEVAARTKYHSAPVIPTLRRLKHEDPCELGASPHHTGRSCLKKQTKHKRNRSLKGQGDTTASPLLAGVCGCHLALAGTLPLCWEPLCKVLSGCPGFSLSSANALQFPSSEPGPSRPHPCFP